MVILPLFSSSRSPSAPVTSRSPHDSLVRWVAETNAPISQAEKLRPELGTEPGLLLLARGPCTRCPASHRLRRVTCESDSQVGPALPAVPGEYDSGSFPVTHTSHSFSGQQAPSLGRRTPAFLTLRKNSCTSSSRESTLLPRRSQRPGGGKCFLPPPSAEAARPGVGAPESWPPARFLPLPQGITLAWPPSLGKVRSK